MTQYTVEAFNHTANRWEIVDTAHTPETALDKLEKFWGKDRDYTEMAILDAQGFIVWNTKGFRSPNFRIKKGVGDVSKD